MCYLTLDASRTANATAKQLLKQGDDVVADVVRNPDFYVVPDGTTLPGTGYRYMASDAPYLNNLKNTMEIPSNPSGTYISFNNYNVPNPGALQVPHDAAIKATFNTKQILDDVRIPNGNWGKASYPEPITTDFPQFGPGGATQAIMNRPIKIDTLTDLRDLP